VVHRFLIRGTVEERMHAAVRSGVEKWSGDKVTLRQLKDLFVSPSEDSSNGPDSCSNNDSSTTPFANIISAPGTSSCANLISSLNTESCNTVTAKPHDSSNDTVVASQNLDVAHDSNPDSFIMPPASNSLAVSSGDVNAETETIAHANSDYGLQNQTTTISYSDININTVEDCNGTNAGT